VRLVVHSSARGSVRLCSSAAVCGSVWQCVVVHVSVCGSALYMHVHKVAHNIYIYIGMPLYCTRSDGSELHMPCISILTDQYVSQRINAN
jgi:hypothetical protein